MIDINIPYSAKKQKNMAYIFLGLGIAGILFAYYAYFIKTEGILFGRVTSVFITLLGIGAFLKLSIAPKKATDIAIAINRQGITGNTTPIARAAGLIEWKDIVDYQIEQGRLLVVLVDPQKYADRMKNFFVRDTFMKGQKGIITISFAETDSAYEEIAKYMIHYVGHNSNVI